MTQKKILLILVGIFAVVGLLAIVGYSGRQSVPQANTESYDSPIAYDASSQETPQAPRQYGLGDSFDVGDYKITLGKEYTFATVQNKYSEENGRLAIRIPFTETNNGDTAGHYYMGLTTYAPTGHETANNNIGVYFEDSNFDVGSVLPGVTQTSYLYILYDGDGEYTLIFDAMLSTETTVKLDIKK